MTDTEILDYLAFASTLVGQHHDAQFGLVTFTLNRPGDKRTFREVVLEAIGASRADPRMSRLIAEKVARELLTTEKVADELAGSQRRGV